MKTDQKAKADIKRRTGLPGGKVPRDNQRKGMVKVSGGPRTPGIGNLPAHIARMYQ